jgi:small nuclear ribonucleoprotein (snRNP)-like protein
VTGTLKGYDQLLNLVMDDVVEEFEGELVSLVYDILPYRRWIRGQSRNKELEEYMLQAFGLALGRKSTRRTTPWSRAALTCRYGQTIEITRTGRPSRSKYLTHQPNRWISR